MIQTTEISCACGETRLALRGAPFLVSECLCNSCRTAAARLAALPGAPNMLTDYAATATADYRKDRVQVVSGMQYLKEFRLSSDAGTRRIIATCCNTPVFQELKGGHWFSIYLHLWPDAARPTPELRTMTGDLPDASGLPDDIPNLKTHSFSFYMKLLGAWIGMGFRNPKLEVTGKIDV